MIIVNTDFVPGKTIKEIVGLVKGNTVRAAHVGKDILAAFRNIVGGEVSDYTKMIAESREQSLDRMIEEAEKLGANAVINIRFATSEVMSSAAEILVYGTAVILE